MPAVTKAYESIEALFRESVSPELERAIVRVIRDASRLAASEAKARFAKDQAREAQPWMRRAALGSSLLSLASDFPSVSITSNRSSGSTFFVQVDTAHVTILVSRARDRNAMLPPASYRTAIALESVQYSLFVGETPRPGARAYTVVLYGGSHENGDPDFIVARFPTGDHAKYLDTTIDLMEEYSDLFVQTAPIEEIQDEQQLTLKQLPATGTSAAP